MPPFNYTRVLAISIAGLTGATFGAMINRWNESKTPKIIDYHVHMMSSQLFETVDSRWKQLENPITVEPNLNSTQLIQKMKQLNIAKSLVVSSAYLYTSESMEYLDYDEAKEKEMVENENKYIYNECRKYPKQLISSFSVHPLKPYSIHEVYRCLKQSNNKICKLHFSNSNVNLWNDTHLHKVKSLFQTISDNNGSVLLHFDNCYMDNVELGEIEQYVTLFMDECVIPFSNLQIIFAHLGGFGGFDTRTADIFESLLSSVETNQLEDRIFFDISSVYLKERPIQGVPALEEKLRLQILLKRMEDNGMLSQLIFGSDYPFIDSSQYIHDIREYSSLSSQKLQSVLSNNNVNV